MANKSDLVDALAERTNLSKKDAEQILDTVIDVVTQTLKKGDKLTISGFGTFSVSARAARTGRNPQTGAAIQISASKNPRFKPGKVLKDAIQ
ncbi:MAG: DNA-binding protein HU [Candidatus Handelsmanbacteria bacterium RIFCSPLOWO2_12_FULL_64_10]|uniref:DNA-binding protein HU n=1 Tax=Handelsmanbacteria sp. (strain RIFCSPLOWO2_12_FULL_64_10) TaxID=1817868 RepID=A0A1F6CQH0_HANXR|nr:MAG: DNA-binding protein HU [Candidatus Handelsmanbacteria bacterium RIFCSPLOWO2_12_FULL_64_10]